MRINLAAEGAAQKNILDFLEKNTSTEKIQSKKHS